MKFCIDCKHFFPEENDPTHRFARCDYLHLPSPVSGQKYRTSMDFCSIQRSSSRRGTCGAEGSFFEAKETTNV